MFIIRDSKGVIFDKRYETEQEALQVINSRSLYSTYASKFWYVEEVQE